MKKFLQESVFAVFIFLFLFSACGDNDRKKEDEGNPEPHPAEPVAPVKLTGQIESPSDGDMFTLGEDIEIAFSPGEPSGQLTSVRLTVDGDDAEFTGTFPGSLVWNTSGYSVGSRQIRIILGFEDDRKETYPLRLVLGSDIVPVQYSYRIVNSYPHDIRAFTQGLVYHDGFLYESTGRYGESTLRKVDFKTGEVLRSLNLDRQLFGEGLCIHDGNLYQLTWKSRVGFIYDIESFRILNRIYYQTEGWGLTSDGTNLLKSDGSHYIYILEPTYFSEVGRLEVFDHNGRVENLNELEFVDNLIYANILNADYIVKFERETGRVVANIDLTGLLDERYHHPNLDVLNGIAYDHDNDRLFVTGKNWPRLFEIELVEK